MNQVGITEVTGAKIVEEYEAPNGITWMLTRLPEECIMDLTESALVTYALNLKMNEREITKLVDDVEQRLASERIVNPLLAEEVENTLEEDQRDRERELEEDLERQRERELEERRAKAEERESNIREKGAHWWWGLANLTVGVVEGIASLALDHPLASTLGAVGFFGAGSAGACGLILSLPVADTMDTNMKKRVEWFMSLVGSSLAIGALVLILN